MRRIIQILTLVFSVYILLHWNNMIGGAVCAAGILTVIRLQDGAVGRRKSKREID